MIRSITLLLALALLAPLTATQASLTFESNDVEGLIARAYSFNHFKLGGLTLQNSFTAKWTDNEDDLELYYIRNYARERLTFIHSGERARIALYGGGEYFFGENIPTHIAGLEDRWDATHGVFGGAEANMHLGDAEIDLRADWWGQWFELSESGGQGLGQGASSSSDDNDEDFLDTNLWGEGKLAWKFGDWLTPYCRFEAFSDMNDIDAYDTFAWSVGDEFSHKLNYVHTLAGSVEFTQDNTFEEYQNAVRLNARLISRFGMEWMLMNRVDFRQYFGDEPNESDGDGATYSGYVETLTQRMLKFNGNRFSRVQFGGRVYPGDETGYVKADVLYWLGRYSIYLDAQKHFDGLRNHKFTAQLGAALWKDRLNLAYAFQMDNRDSGDVVSHFVRLELMQ